MKLFTLKSAYFVVTTFITLSIIAGGLTIVIMNNEPSNVIWAQQLVGMIVTLWVPSPAENLKQIIYETNSEQSVAAGKTNEIQKIVIHSDIEKGNDR